MRSLSWTAALALLVAAQGLAGSAGADAVEEALGALPGLVAEGAGQAAAVAGAASSGALGAGEEAARALPGQTGPVVAGAAQQAGEAFAAAAQAGYEALVAASHAPDPLYAEASRKYDDLELVPGLAGDFLQRRIAAIPDSNRPWLEGAAETTAPYLAALGATGRLTFEFHMPIGEVPEVGAGFEQDPVATLPDMARLPGDLGAYAGANLPRTEGWVEAAAEDARATAGEVVAVVLR
jgi:hypothetical protein